MKAIHFIGCKCIQKKRMMRRFVKQHKTLRATPAMAAGLTKGFMSVDDTVKQMQEKTQGKEVNTKRK